MANFDDRESYNHSTEISDHPIMAAKSISEIEEDESNFAIGLRLAMMLIFPAVQPLDPAFFAVSSVLYVLTDPLILYVPLINEDTNCVKLDHRLMLAALVLRTLGDVRYVVRIILRTNDGWWASHSLKKIAMSIAIDTLSVLPLPQVVIFMFLPNLRGTWSLTKLKFLNSLILLQYLPRVYPLCKFCKDVNNMNLDQKTRDKDYKWFPILVNFFGYILAGHVLGAFWYFFSIQREIECWAYACRTENGCEFSTSCDENTFGNTSLVKTFCPINPADATVFDFGIFLYALQSRLQTSTNFLEKFLQCFSWGLRNLSSFASNLNTSSYGWENLFVVAICISGLVLFIYLLGHLQTFMQAINRSDSLRQKMKLIIEPKIRSMLSEYGLPNEMESKIQHAVKKILEENEDLILESMFSILTSDLSEIEETKDLHMEIKCSLFLDKLNRVDGLKNKHDEVLKKICEHLEPVIYTEGTYLMREGEPLDMMFFITQGIVLTYATMNAGLSGTVQLEKEKYGLYGEELLTWAEGPSSKLSNLPISPITVKSHKKVEVFALKATDLQLVVSKFPNHFNVDSTLKEIYSSRQ